MAKEKFMERVTRMVEKKVFGKFRAYHSRNFVRKQLISRGTGGRDCKTLDNISSARRVEQRSSL